MGKSVWPVMPGSVWPVMPGSVWPSLAANGMNRTSLSCLCH